MTPKFIIDKAKDGQWFFNLVAANNEVIATSETYTTRQACIKGTEAVRTAAPIAETIIKDTH